MTGAGLQQTSQLLSGFPRHTLGLKEDFQAAVRQAAAVWMPNSRSQGKPDPLLGLESPLALAPPLLLFTMSPDPPLISQSWGKIDREEKPRAAREAPLSVLLAAGFAIGLGKRGKKDLGGGGARLPPSPNGCQAL